MAVVRRTGSAAGLDAFGEMRLKLGSSTFPVIKEQVRDSLGRFKTMDRSQAEIDRENLALARNLQRQVVLAQQSRFIRQRPGSGRLARSTMHRRNIEWSWLGIGVGNLEWLEDKGSPAPYARTIEEGSAETWRRRNFLMLDLWGTWGSVGAPVGARGRMNAIGGFGREAHGTGYFAPRLNMPLQTPKRHIRPQNAYSAALGAMNTKTLATEQARKAAARYMMMAVESATTAAANAGRSQAEIEFEKLMDSWG